MYLIHQFFSFTTRYNRFQNLHQAYIKILNLDFSLSFLDADNVGLKFVDVGTSSLALSFSLENLKHFLIRQGIEVMWFQ